MNPLTFHKSLPVLFLPLGLSLLLLCAALRWRRRILIAFPLAILWIFSTPAIADMVMRSLEDRYPYRPDANRPAADAVFVLGGGILDPRTTIGGGVEWGESAERFHRGLLLYTSGQARSLVLSHNPGEGDRLKQVAIQQGVPPDSVVLTRETLNTADEADGVTELAVRLHWKRILLVTSAFHMPRAMRLFRRCPAEIIPVPVNYQTRAPGQPPERILEPYLPQAGALSESERALREYLGILFYSIMRQ